VSEILLKISSINQGLRSEVKANGDQALLIIFVNLELAVEFLRTKKKERQEVKGWKLFDSCDLLCFFVIFLIFFDQFPSLARSSN